MSLYQENIILNCPNKFVLFSYTENRIFCFIKKSKGASSVIYVFEDEILANEAKELLVLKSSSFSSFYAKNISNSPFLSKRQKAKCIVFNNIQDFKTWIS